jgi:hypothetical protein
MKTYLISNLKSEIDSANILISKNMGLGDSDEVTKFWDNPIQIKASSTIGSIQIPAHPVYTADPSKLNWWAIQKPETRFMTGVSLTEIEV